MTQISTEHRAPQTPADLDRAIVSQASRLGIGLRVKIETRYPKDKNGNSLPAYQIVTGCEVDGSLTQAAGYADRLEEQHMRPADPLTIQGWLAELSVKVARRPSEEVEDRLRLRVYTDELKAYPADVVHHALCVHRYTFWPTWEELAKVCDQLAAPRKVMIHALRNPTPPEEPRQRVTAERADEIMRQAGFTSSLSEAIQRRPMATTVDEAMQDVDEKPAHWSETAGPDDPRRAALERSRAENKVIQQSKAHADLRRAGDEGEAA